MKSRTNKILIISAILSTIGLVVMYFAYSQIGRLNIQNDELALEITTLYAQAIKADSLKKIVSNAGEKNISLEQYFVPAGEEVEFIKKIEELASAVDLKYTTNSITTISDEKLGALDKELLELGISTEGSWQNTRRFISLLETLPMNVRFNSLDMKTSITSVTVNPTAGETISTSTPVISRKVWSTNIKIAVVKNK